MALVILSYLTIVAAGIDVFHSNCTLPDSKVTFTTAPNTRGTLDIVWSSLATIIACVFTVLHLNVPEQPQGRDAGWTGFLYWGLKGLWTSLQYSLLMAFVPEFLLGKSIRDLRVAQKSLEELHRDVPETKDTWKLEHMLYAGMGGFVAVDRSDESVTIEAVTTDAASSTNIRHNSEIALPTSPSSTREGITNLPPDLESETTSDKAMSTLGDLESNTRASQGGRQQSTDRPSLYHLTCETLVLALKKNLLPKQPPLSVAEIMDKSKSDVVSKTVAVFQICYFLVCVIVRAARHLPVSPLELGTCAFVPYAVVIYLYSHKKVKAPRTVAVLPGLSAHAAASLSGETHDLLSLLPGRSTHRNGAYIPNHCFEHVPDIRHRFISWDVGGIPITLSILFGAIHTAAWDYDFPTQIDATLWRTASIMTTAMLPCLGLALGHIVMIMRVALEGIPKKGDIMDPRWFGLTAKPMSLLRPILFMPFIAFYLLVRLVIVVEMFRTLAYLPPNSYVTTWTTNAPHIT